jgi:aspartate aminotransferase-like enzyme
MTGDDPLLMIPGPTNLPDEVREALARPSIYHRGDEAAELIARCEQGLKKLLGTEGDALILTCSGTGAMEAAITSSLSPGDDVLCVEAGKFGERMGDIAEAFGANVTRCHFEYGRAADPGEVAAALVDGRYRAALCAVNETSTGMAHPIDEIAAVATEAGAFVIADCVSCLGGVAVDMDARGLALVAAGSQKCLMLPPGLAVVGVSPQAWEKIEQATMPRYYFDLTRARESAAKGQTPWTVNTSLLAGLVASLDLIEAEGIERVFARHRAMASAVRAAMTAGGLELFADPGHASETVTAIKSPAGVDSVELVRRVWESGGVLISGGQGDLKGRIFRIGHMGRVDLGEVLRTVEAVAGGLVALGHECDAGEMLVAAELAGAGD